MEIKVIVENALREAMNSADGGGPPLENPTGTSKKELHHRRSQHFVACLAKELERNYEGRAGVFVLSGGFSKHKARFGVNELLYDVLVCEAMEIPSSSGQTRLTAVTKGLVAVESELARDSRQAVIDFNKLVLSSCETKLFVGSQVHDRVSFNKTLETSASHCSGHVHLALIPHPDKWDGLAAEEASVEYWKWDGIGWV